MTDTESEERTPGLRALWVAAKAAVERLDIPRPGGPLDRFGWFYVTVEDYTVAIAVCSDDGLDYFGYAR